MCFIIEHLVNTKVFTEKNESHPIYLQPTAKEEDGRGCWGITLMKTAKLRQGVCSGGRREGSRPPHPSRGLWWGACCNEKHDKGDNKSFLIKWLSHILISAHKKEMRGLCGSHRVSLMWFFFSSSVFHCGLLWLCFWHGVSFFFSSERYHRHFRNISFVFCTQKNDTSTTEWGQQLPFLCLSVTKIFTFI